MGQEASTDFKTSIAEKDAKIKRQHEQEKKEKKQRQDKYDEELKKKVKNNPEKYINKMVSIIRQGFLNYPERVELLFRFTKTDPWNDHRNGFSICGAGHGKFRVTVSDYNLMKKVQNRNFEPIIQQATEILSKDGITLVAFKSSTDYLATRNLSVSPDTASLKRE